MEEEDIAAERVKNSCEESSYNPRFVYSLWLWDTQIDLCCGQPLSFWTLDGFSIQLVHWPLYGFSLVSPHKLFQFYRRDWVFSGSALSGGEYLCAGPCQGKLCLEGRKAPYRQPAQVGGSRSKFSPGCRVFSLTTCAVFFEGAKQAHGPEGQRGILCPGPQAAGSLCLVLFYSPQQLHWPQILEEQGYLCK